jgi:hypothetical protein
MSKRHHRIRYGKGADDERAIMKMLLKLSYHTAVRSAGSRGPVDVIGIGSEKIILISATRIGQDEVSRRDALQAMLCPENVVKELWVKRPYHGWDREVVK